MAFSSTAERVFSSGTSGDVATGTFDITGALWTGTGLTSGDSVTVTDAGGTELFKAYAVSASVHSPILLVGKYKNLTISQISGGKVYFYKSAAADADYR